MIFVCLVSAGFVEGEGSKVAWGQGGLGEQELVCRGLKPGQNPAPCLVRGVDDCVLVCVCVCVSDRHSLLWLVSSPQKYVHLQTHTHTNSIIIQLHDVQYVPSTISLSSDGSEQFVSTCSVHNVCVCVCVLSLSI